MKSTLQKYPQRSNEELSYAGKSQAANRTPAARSLSDAKAQFPCSNQACHALKLNGRLKNDSTSLFAGFEPPGASTLLVRILPGIHNRCVRHVLLLATQ